jgi:hypothetical protein
LRRSAISASGMRLRIRVRFAASSFGSLASMGARYRRLARHRRRGRYIYHRHHRDRLPGRRHGSAGVAAGLRRAVALLLGAPPPTGEEDYQRIAARHLGQPALPPRCDRADRGRETALRTRGSRANPKEKRSQPKLAPTACPGRAGIRYAAELTVAMLWPSSAGPYRPDIPLQPSPSADTSGTPEPSLRVTNSTPSGRSARRYRSPGAQRVAKARAWPSSQKTTQRADRTSEGRQRRLTQVVSPRPGENPRDGEA